MVGLLSSNGRLVFVVLAALLAVGFYGVIASKNLIKKIISLGAIQVSVILLYVAVGFRGQTAFSPVYVDGAGSVLYTNPLPQVLMLTAIVVGVSVTSICFTVIIKIYQSFGTIDDEKVDQMASADEVSSDSV